LLSTAPLPGRYQDEWLEYVSDALLGATTVTITISKLSFVPHADRAPLDLDRMGTVGMGTVGTDTVAELQKSALGIFAGGAAEEAGVDRAQQEMDNTMELLEAAYVSVYWVSNVGVLGECMYWVSVCTG
jgi:hypothetical protein